jgi:hypothetical protein
VQFLLLKGVEPYTRLFFSAKFAASGNGRRLYTWDIVEKSFWADRRYAEIMGVDYSNVDRGLPAESLLETVHQDDRAGVIGRLKMTVIDWHPFETAYRVTREDAFILVKDYGRCMRSVDGYATLFTGIVFEILEAISNTSASNSNRLDL